MGICITAIVEAHSEPSEYSRGGWRHVLTLKLFKDYALMHLLEDRSDLVQDEWPKDVSDEAKHVSDDCFGYQVCSPHDLRILLDDPSVVDEDSRPSIKVSALLAFVLVLVADGRTVRILFFRS